MFITKLIVGAVIVLGSGVSGSSTSQRRPEPIQHPPEPVRQPHLRLPKHSSSLRRGFEGPD